MRLKKHEPSTIRFGAHAPAMLRDALLLRGNWDRGLYASAALADAAQDYWSRRSRPRDGARRRGAPRGGARRAPPASAEADAPFTIAIPGAGAPAGEVGFFDATGRRSAASRAWRAAYLAPAPAGASSSSTAPRGVSSSWTSTGASRATWPARRRIRIRTARPSSRTATCSSRPRRASRDRRGGRDRRRVRAASGRALSRGGPPRRRQHGLLDHRAAGAHPPAHAGLEGLRAARARRRLGARAVRPPPRARGALLFLVPSLAPRSRRREPHGRRERPPRPERLLPLPLAWKLTVDETGAVVMISDAFEIRRAHLDGPVTRFQVPFAPLGAVYLPARGLFAVSYMHFRARRGPRAGSPTRRRAAFRGRASPCSLLAGAAAGAAVFFARGRPAAPAPPPAPHAAGTAVLRRTAARPDAGSSRRRPRSSRSRSTPPPSSSPGAACSCSSLTSIRSGTCRSSPVSRSHSRRRSGTAA